MSSASSASGLSNRVDQAEKDLAMYAAIIGCRPTVTPAQPAEPTCSHEYGAVDGVDDAHPHRKPLTIWMRHLSHEAKKRIHEAALRLAS